MFDQSNVGTIVPVKSAQAEGIVDLSSFASDGWRFAAVVAAGVLCVTAPSFFKNYYNYRTKALDSSQKYELEMTKFGAKLVNRTKNSGEESDVEKMRHKIKTKWKIRPKEPKEANELRSPKRQIERGSDDSDV